MNLEQRLRESLVAPDPGAVFTARVMARMTRGRTRRGRRFIVIGTVLVAGVAAAMLAWEASKSPSSPVPAEIAAIPTATDLAPVVAAHVVQATPAAGESPAAPPAVEIAPASPKYSVVLMPLRHQAQTVVERDRVEAFYSAVVEAFHAVPGVVLQGPGGLADYAVTITSLATRVTPSGGVQVRATDGGATYNVDSKLSWVDQDYGSNPLTGAREYRQSRGFEPGSAGTVAWIEMRVEPRGGAPAWYTLSIGPEGSSSQSRCATDFASLKPECMTAAQLASRQIEKLRMEVFPPDAELQQTIAARLGDARLTEPDRFQVLQDLLRLQSLPEGVVEGRTSRLDGAALRTLTRHAATLRPFLRAQTWIMLRRVPHPVLVQPLIDSLSHDTDRQVRLEALATLMTSYATDPSVRTALESVAQRDANDAVRIAARRELYGPAQWRSDVTAVLDNTSLPYESRLAPLRTASTLVSNSRSEDLQALLQDRQVLLKLVDLVRLELDDDEHAKTTSEMLVLLSNIRDPVVSELFAEARRQGIDPPGTRVGSAALNSNGEVVISGSTVIGEVPLVPTTLLERMREVTQGAKQE